MKNKYTIEGACTRIHVVRRNGSKHCVFIDTEDIPKLDGWSVSLLNANTYGELLRAQVCRANGQPKDGNWNYLHRHIMGAQKGFDVDHINHDQLDNRKTNLRVISHAENAQNKKGPARNNKTSGVRGVTWFSRDGSWQAQCMVDREYHYLGRYATIEEASKVVSEFRRTHLPYSELDK